MGAGFSLRRNSFRENAAKREEAVILYAAAGARRGCPAGAAHGIINAMPQPRRIDGCEENGGTGLG